MTSAFYRGLVYGLPLSLLLWALVILLLFWLFGDIEA